ncbi:MAG TPA: acylphosphatase [Puia sp.]|nr:acylphosphatase [Puia sp.]
MPTVHLLIKGKVQGVFYRASAKAAAERLHITGWVKNTPEGHVEALASGEEGGLRQFVEWCRKGPGKAVVSEVIELERRPDEEARGNFAIIR